MITVFAFPTVIRVGAGTVSEVAPLLRSKSCHRPMIVTDSMVATLPFFRDLVTTMRDEGLDVAVFSGFSGNPLLAHVEAGVAYLKNHEADSLVLVGGGAALDVGKAIGLMAHHPGHLFDYEDGSPNCPPMDQPIPYTIAVPTTAGTGSEVGRSSVIAENETKRKRIIFSPRLLPSVVIADAELTVNLPPAVTAATGIDALTHLIEAFLAKGYHPMCDGIALEGIRLVREHLRAAVSQPDNLVARQGMLVAAMMGAVAFQKGLGVNHSCAHALSTVFDTHHGLANAIMLPSCMAFNYEVCHAQFDRLGDAMGCKGSDVVAWISQLRADIGLPATLSEIHASINEKLLDAAQADGCHASNPRSVSRAQFRSLFKAAMEG